MPEVEMPLTDIFLNEMSTTASAASCHLFGLSTDRTSNSMLEVQMGDEPLDWEWYLAPKVSTNTISSGTPLHVACHLGKSTAAKMLLSYGANVDSLDSSLQTPLHIAVKSGDLEVVSLLVEWKANLNARDLDLRTPAMLAAMEGHLELIHLLSKAGADLFLRDLSKRQALHLAAGEGHGEVVYYLVHAGGDLTACDEEGISAIDYALTATSNSLRSGLFDDPVVQVNSCSLEAVKGLYADDPGALERAIRHFSPSTLTHVINHCSRTLGLPLHQAITRGRYENLKILLDAGADINASGRGLGRPLMLACSLGRLPAVKVLLRRGAQTSYTEDGVHFNVIDAAKHHFDILQWLMVGRFTDHPKMIEGGKCSI